MDAATETGRNPVNKHQIQSEYVWRKSRLKRDRTAEPVSQDQFLRRERGQENLHFSCSADHEQDWQPHPVDPYSAICDDHTYHQGMTVLLPRQDHERPTTNPWMLSRKRRCGSRPGKIGMLD